MAENFMGFSNDEILKITGVKKQSARSNAETGKYRNVSKNLFASLVCALSKTK